MNLTKNSITETVTHLFLEKLEDKHQDPLALEQDLMEMLGFEIDQANAMLTKSRRIPMPLALNCRQIADILLATEDICVISALGSNSDRSRDFLGLYQKDGPTKGIYETGDEAFRNLARRYRYDLTTKDGDEIISLLKDLAPLKEQAKDPDLIAVNNGIFNYKTKELLPFSPDYVFLAKSRVNYIDDPQNPMIVQEDGTTWDVESWIEDLTDDPEIVQVIWEILGAIVRPHVAWNKAAFLYSQVGNNGKGTLCALMRNLCGEGSYATIPIADFSKDFMLEPLTRASAIIVDENDVGTYIEKAGNFKSAITKDAIQINRKFKNPITYRFHGFMVQCLNEYPRLRDRTDSFYRRCLFVPFEKSFTGHENTAIKNDYLHRQEVLEYVLHKVLNTNYYSLSEPQASKEILDEYKEFNDPVRQFCEEVIPEVTWDLLPFNFLYDLYAAWHKKNSPAGQPLGKQSFTKQMETLLPSLFPWETKGRTLLYSRSNAMDKPERLIYEYDLKDWKNRSYKGSDPDQISSPKHLSNRYRGFMRIKEDEDPTPPDNPPEGPKPTPEGPKPKDEASSLQDALILEDVKVDYIQTDKSLKNQSDVKETSVKAETVKKTSPMRAQEDVIKGTTLHPKPETPKQPSLSHQESLKEDPEDALEAPSKPKHSFQEVPKTVSEVSLTSLTTQPPYRDPLNPLPSTLERLLNLPPVDDKRLQGGFNVLKDPLSRNSTPKPRSDLESSQI